MSWFTKVLGIDARRNAERAAADQAKKTADAETAAAQLQAATAKQQAEYQQSMLNIQNEAQKLSTANRADLSTDTATNVVAGGSADSVTADARKKKAAVGAGIAASLGINV